MARRKKSQYSNFFGDLSPTDLLLHPATLFVVFNIALAATAVYCWERYQNKIVDPRISLLSAEKIQVNTPPPAWAKTNIKEAILTATGESKSLFDPELISDAVATCQSIGWIERVQRMEKTRDGLNVDLIYRDPIAVVELDDNTVPGWKQQPKLIPVDRMGVIMPEALALSGSIQPKIFIHHWDGSQNSTPQHLSHIRRWTAWPDARVQDAAAISEVLFQDWQAFGLCRIISRRQIQDVQDKTIPFELWSDEGPNAAIVLWGNPPGSEIENEAPFDLKVAALRAYVEQHGPLNKLPERVIDLRSGQAIPVGNASALGFRPNFEVR